MFYFRKRFGFENINEINEMIANIQKQEDKDDDEPKNKGVMLIDATCAPADIRYPTDISLLNETREKTEKIIDTLYEPFKGTMKKPRIYRQKARKRYLAISKKRKVKANNMRKAVGQQLRYLVRNFKHIKKLKGLSDSAPLSCRQEQELAVIKTLYDQLKQMYEQKSHTVKDRIVSINQPHVRPIVKGRSKHLSNLGLTSVST